MRYLILALGIFSIAVVTILNFYPDEARDFIYNLFNHEEYTIAVANDYYLNGNFKYVSNYTDDVSSRQELINYIYYVINTGSDYADGECTKEYTDCISDISQIAKDSKYLSLLNNFVHPYNSFRTLSFTYNDRGKFSIAIEHIYSDEDIAAINYKIDNKLSTLINDEMSTYDKIKALHDYIIDNATYDSLKTDNINDETYRSNTAYGVFIQGYGICSGYSDAMAILLNKIGIQNYKISNDTHIWNLVYINGVWAHLDATWDDPISTYNVNRDSYFLIDYDKLVSYKDETHDFDKYVYPEAY